MGRHKLTEKQKKIRISITLDKDINNKLEKETYNKSQFVERLIEDYFKNKTQ